MAHVCNAPNILSVTPGCDRRVRLIFMNSTDLHWSKETVIHVFIDDKDILLRKVIPIKFYAQEDKTMVVEFTLELNNWAVKE